MAFLNFSFLHDSTEFHFPFLREQKGLDWVIKSCSSASVWQGLRALKDNVSLRCLMWKYQLFHFSFYFKINECHLVSSLSTLLISLRHHITFCEKTEILFDLLSCLKFFLSAREWKFSTFLFVCFAETCFPDNLLAWCQRSPKGYLGTANIFRCLSIGKIN